MKLYWKKILVMVVAQNCRNGNSAEFQNESRLVKDVYKLKYAWKLK